MDWTTFLTLLAQLAILWGALLVIFCISVTIGTAAVSAARDSMRKSSTRRIQ